MLLIQNRLQPDGGLTKEVSTEKRIVTDAVPNDREGQKAEYGKMLFRFAWICSKRSRMDIRLHGFAVNDQRMDIRLHGFAVNNQRMDIRLHEFAEDFG